MYKKQRNRKTVQQNNRNRIINKRYISTIKTLSKLFNLKIKELQGITIPEERTKEKVITLNILKNLYSIIDKAVKKGILHKNTAARKKSKVGKLYFTTIQY
jgi:small subunit ribosomal protein S20